MTRTAFLIFMVAIAAIAFIAMWLAWRARQRRGAGISTFTGELAGALVAEFPRVAYVSTTPLGRPLERVAIRGLVYKGNAELTLRDDGVEIAVTGEPPVRIGADRLRGTGTARGRIGKVVERDGLAVLQWQPESGDEVLESSFRFADPAEQGRFSAVIQQISDSATPSSRSTV